MKAWFLITWLLSGHFSWEGPMTLDDCTNQLLLEPADSKKEYLRACYTETQLIRVLETGSPDDL